MAKLKTGRHTTAIETQRQSERRAAHNKLVRKNARLAAKAIITAAAANDLTKAQSLLPAAASTWDKAAKSGVIHWKTAARRKSRLAAHVAKIAVKTPTTA